MSLRFRRLLLDHIRHDKFTPRRAQDLAADLAVTPDQRDEMDETLRELAAEKLVDVSATGVVSLPSLSSKDGLVKGTFRKALKGFGFVKPDEAVREGSIFIPPEGTSDALSGDSVLVRLFRDPRRDRPASVESEWIGQIVEIVKRKRSNFTGLLTRRGDLWVVLPDGKELTAPVVVRDAEAKNARQGDKVVVELLVYPEGNELGEGVVVRALGAAGRPDVETQATIAAYNLPGEFADDCHGQAREATQLYEDEIEAFSKRGIGALEGRKDLTGDFIITIDPPDAKDYDDAISIVRTDKGWELGVHIADVAHFIPPDSPIDQEAKTRGNSCYLPRHVIPMIPELLSNGICSLQEGVYRFCKSAFMRYDRDGNISGEGVGQTLIKSAKRLTYLEAQALIDGDIDEARRHAKTPPRYTDQLLETLKEMNALARALQGRRQRQGMISLELPDVVLIYDEHGHVVDAEREDDAFTHTLIEMFMVEANEVLARLFEGLQVPLIRRVHPDPAPGDVDNLRKAAMVAGYRIPKNPTREELQGLVNATKGTPAARAVHMAVLRTLAKAEYSPALIGHFALASTAYAHFTSPIRRYADLTVHRALAEYLRLTDNGVNRPKGEGEKITLGKKLAQSPMCPSEQELVDIGRHATMTEKNAEEAEEHLRTFLVLQLLEKHIGEAYPGVVTGVNNRGIFVQIDKYLADGFVKSSDLPGDVTRSSAPPFWKIDPRSGALVDQRSGRSFNMGDSVKVRIVAVDLARRQLELVVDDAAGRAAGKAKLIPQGGGMGGLGGGAGAGFGAFGKMAGTQRRSQKSKSRDKGKPDWRKERRK